MSRDIPQGIEVLVKKASVDAAFRAILLDRRAAAAAEIGLELDPAESMMLQTVPRDQLEAIIARTTVPAAHRRVFLGKTAAAMLAAIGGGLVAIALLSSAGCRARSGNRKARLDTPSNPDLPQDPPAAGGVRPDLPAPNPAKEKPDL